MFATCLFCHSSLGSNESLEHFPVGKRLAYDASKGRLWVVCGKCERWNLSPLEERWEAIEEAERAYSGTKKRVATDNVGLARLAEGTELVRIGAPLRPEFAAWRYGDQFGRRWRRQWLIAGGGAAVFGSVALGGPMVGIATGGFISFVANGFNYGNLLYQKLVPRVRVMSPDGAVLPLTTFDMRKAQFSLRGADKSVRVTFPYRPLVPAGALLNRFGIRQRPATSGELLAELEGDVAIRAMGRILPLMNGSGGTPNQVKRAVATVESHGQSLGTLLGEALKHESSFSWGTRPESALRIPAAYRLALEMTLHEDDERRALEGELHLLEQRWMEAEEIAAIADGLTLDAGLEQRVVSLREPHE